MVDRRTLLYLGACAIRAAHPEYSADLCLASAADLLAALDRSGVHGPFPHQSITPPAGPDPWDTPAHPIARPRGAGSYA